jgi:hypothetical protein
MKRTNKFFIILRPFVFFITLAIGIVILLHFVLVMYNDFFQNEEHSIARRTSSLHISDNTKDYNLLTLTLEVHSSRPITFSIRMFKNNRFLQKTSYYKSRSHTDDPISDIELEFPKLVCNRRSIWGNYRATYNYKIALLPNGSIILLDKNITNQKNITLEYLINNSQNKFIGQESNVDWGPIWWADNFSWFSTGPTASRLIISGSIDDLPIYEILLKIYRPESERQKEED